MYIEKVVVELSNFFNLNKNSDLFILATKPRSCGGGSDFEQLAAYGDKILDIHLISHFIDSGYETKGEITQERQKIHNEPILVSIAKELQIDKILQSVSGEQIGDKDLSECIEALIGANYKFHDIHDSEEIVSKIIKIYEEKDLSVSSTSSHNFTDPVSLLIQLFQSNGQLFSKDLLEPERIGGSDHNPIFQVKAQIKFGITDYHDLTVISY